MNKGDFELLEAYGWVVECESPFEIRKDESFATGEAAHMVLENIRGDCAAGISASAGEVDGVSMGVVKAFNTDRGYGFIARNGGGRDLFFHFKDAELNLSVGDAVEYEVGHGVDGRPAAKKVRSIG